MRDDLPRGIQSAQIIHAAGESSPGKLPSGTFAVSLMVRDEDTLMSWAFRLQQAKVPHVLVFEPDAPFNGALMAIGVVPDRKEVLHKHLSTLPRLR